MTPDQLLAELSDYGNAPSPFPVECECGWTSFDRTTRAVAQTALYRHAKGRTCPLSKTYVPAEARRAEWLAKQSAAASARKGKPLRPRHCTALTGDCTCRTCERAGTDEGAPLDLGGRWVANGRGTKAWVAA